MARTHEVFNQVEPLQDHDLWAGDRSLQDALRLQAPRLDTTDLERLGRSLGQAHWQEQARLAHQHRPVLHTHSPQGRRIDRVEFHPAYHALMGHALSAGLHGSAWVEGRAHAHVERAAGFLMFAQLDSSVLCPVSMTYAVVPALRGHGALWASLAPRLAHRGYQPDLLPWPAKSSLTMGMGMTEKQGGSDVRANTTAAQPDGHDDWGERYRITGHKWFFSAPMSDAFLVLAQTQTGLTCFFLPRVLPDGSPNALHIQRLKDKLGNQANASSEVEFDQAWAWRVGPEGRGLTQILEMGTLTRLDCALGTSGLMRAALSLALDHARQRQAFGRALIDQPAMQNVLADLALESEAATALSLRLARAYDERERSPQAALLSRLLTPVAKFWICKRGSAFAQEAMECLGGNGYVEEGGQGLMARIYREMPLNSIWEGAGNIMALDLLRALRQDGALACLQAELEPVRGAHPVLDRALQCLPVQLEPMASAVQARRLAQELALVVQAALLFQSAPGPVASAFCQSRLGGQWGHTFGTLAPSADLQAIVARAMPR